MNNLFHITEQTNKTSILKNGLLRNGHAFICLCKDVNNWIGMFENPFILKINIEAYVQDNPNIDIRTWQPQSDEICVWGDIPLKYISEEEQQGENK